MKKLLLSPVWSFLVLAILSYTYYINPPFLESIKLRYFDTLIVNQQPVENNIYTVNIDESAINEYDKFRNKNSYNFLLSCANLYGR